MKRVKAACIFQTLVFQQKENSGLSREQMLHLNRMEVKRYKEGMDQTRTRYRIDSEEERPDGAIELKIRKQYNDKAEIAPYLD